MIAILADELFGGTGKNLKLFALFQLLAASRHVCQLESPSGQLFKKWLAGLDAKDQEDIRGIVVAGTLQLAQPIKKLCAVRVTAASEDKWNTTPELGLDSALRFLRLPFLVFFENNRADRTFLEAFMLPEERTMFREYLKEGWIDMRHGGGLGEMRQQILDEATSRSGIAVRAYALFDSDAMYPNEPSDESKRAKKTCSECGVAHFQLRRRSIENYLPPDVLSVFAHKARSARLHAAYRAFVRMQGPQRFHFNVRGGFNGDVANAERAKDLYDDLDVQQRRALERGFGQDVASMFSRTDFVVERRLKEDGGWDELRPEIANLLRML